MNLSIPRTLTLISGVMLLLCTSCARPRTTVSFPPPHEASREQIIEALQKEAFDFQSLKSLAQVTVAYPYEGKMKRQSFEGALLYRETGEFRFQGFGFLGRTLFDLSYKPNRLVLYIPSSSIAYEGTPGPLTDFRDADVFTVARRTIMGIGESYEQATFHFPHDVYSPQVDNGAGHHLLLNINPHTLLIDKKIVLQNGKASAEIEYQNYKQFGRKSFPTLVTISLPLQRTAISFDFESLVVNEDVPDNLFNLALPSHVKRLPLSELSIDLPAVPAT